MNRWLIVFLLVLTALRLSLGGSMEVLPDEAYYYQWSQRMDWAYYSKGPGVAAVIRAGTALFGPTSLGVRFFSPLFALGTSLILYGLARRLYGESVGIWTVLMLNFTPLFNVGGLLMTIDPISIFFWSAALWTLWEALERAPKFSLYWPATGLLIGLGFLGKYTNAMELVTVVLILALTPKLRREFLRPGFWVMLAVFAVAILPPVIWNANHGWITLDHLANRGGLEGKFALHPLGLLGFIGGHFGIYSPLIFAGMLVALWQGCRAMKEDFKARFLLLGALPLIVMYCLLSLKRAGELNWTAPAFVSLGIYTAAYWHEQARENAKTRRWAGAALGLGLALSLLILNTDVLRALHIPWSYAKDPGARLRGWQSIAEAVGDLRHQQEAKTGRPMFLIANSYGNASILSFYLPEKRVDGPGHPPVYIPESPLIENQYSFWGRYDELTEAPVIARAMLPKVTDPALHGTLEAALKAFDKPETDEQALTRRRRTLIRAMLLADPKLPLDEYDSEEWGISLFAGRDALYVTDTPEKKRPSVGRLPKSIREGFQKVDLVGHWREERRGMPLRLIWVYACHNYHTSPL